jgi:hypothetical protein
MDIHTAFFGELSVHLPYLSIWVHQLSLTFINANIKWITLMPTLHMLNKNHMNILENFDELESKHFANLVKSNLVTCTRYYDHRMATFHILLKKDSSIYGKVDDFLFCNKISE